MAIIGTTIQKPIEWYQVSNSILDSSTTLIRDLKTLCESAYEWSKYKPIDFDAKEITQTDLYNKNYGMFVPPAITRSQLGALDSGTRPSSWPGSYEPLLYITPKGGEHSMYRLGDYNGYDFKKYTYLWWFNIDSDSYSKWLNWNEKTISHTYGYSIDFFAFNTGIGLCDLKDLKNYYIGIAVAYGSTYTFCVDKSKTIDKYSREDSIGIGITTSSSTSTDKTFQEVFKNTGSHYVRMIASPTTSINESTNIIVLSSRQTVLIIAHGLVVESDITYGTKTLVDKTKDGSVPIKIKNSGTASLSVTYLVTYSETYNGTYNNTPWISVGDTMVTTYTTTISAGSTFELVAHWNGDTYNKTKYFKVGVSYDTSTVVTKTFSV